MRFFVIFLLFLSACSSSQLFDESASSEPIKKSPSTDAVVELTLSERKYKSLLEVEGALNRARLIQIYSRDVTASAFNQFRLFDIQEGSIFDYLGLKNLDVIMAADGYIIPSPASFWGYLSYIGNYKSGSLEIRRQGRPLLLKYKLVK